jgi:hypothetical protein
VTKLKSVVEVAIDPYNYKPGEDPLNLKSLFDKFPQDSINVNLKAILTFSLDEEKLPKRNKTKSNGEYSFEILEFTGLY